MSGDRLKKDEKFDSIYVYLPLNKIYPTFYNDLLLTNL